MMWCKRLTIMLIFALPLPVSAVEQWAPTAIEMSGLPPFCKVRFGSRSNSPEYKAWEQTLGPDFEHTHHYCAGLNFINRSYKARTTQDKSYNLQNALNNFQYMINHASLSYSLMPDVYLNRGIVNSLMDRNDKAISDIMQALKLNPRMVRAYQSLADIYIKSKLGKEALDTVTTGLRYIPNSKGLQRRYKELGGKLPYPEPVAPVEGPSDKDAASAAKSSNQVEPETDDASGNEVEEVDQNQNAENQVMKQDDNQGDKSKIGVPGNPYCRFCP